MHRVLNHGQRRFLVELPTNSVAFAVGSEPFIEGSLLVPRLRLLDYRCCRIALLVHPHPHPHRRLVAFVRSPIPCVSRSVLKYATLLFGGSARHVASTCLMPEALLSTLYIRSFDPLILAL